MELTLNRTYFSRAVLGELFKGAKPICQTMELPWLGDDDGESCIPEGRYRLKPRFTNEEGWHLEVGPIPNRPRVIIHALGKAEHHPGSIVPLGTKQVGDLELVSRTANIRLKKLVFDAHENRDPVYLTIRNKPN
jgi:hypothetical protein